MKIIQVTLDSLIKLNFIVSIMVFDFLQLYTRNMSICLLVKKRLTCGCNGHEFGPLSVRRNDLFSFSKSKLNDQLADLQRVEEFEFVAYGDSAYILLYLSHNRARHNYEYNSPRHILENKTLSSCRECIEWDWVGCGEW